MEEYIQISKLNDFIFCPKSMYLHSIYEGLDTRVYHSHYQTAGKLNHECIDNKKYSSAKKSILQGIEVYSHKYNLVGKIDLYFKDKKELMERKTKINRIYDGYRFQLYAQYFCLLEEGYEIEKISVHSLKDNKKYYIDIPNEYEIKRFEILLNDIKRFSMYEDRVKKNKNKCEKCIYNNLCN